MNLISLFIVSLLTENIVLTKFLGMCPFFGTSKAEKNALSMGISVMIVVVLSSLITFFINTYILIPTNTVYLKTIVFILVIAAIVQIVEIILKKYYSTIYKSLGLYLPLITTNCAVLGTVLLESNSNYNLIETLVFSIGSSLGFTLVIYVFASIRERLEQCNIPKNFRGYPIALITASIMALVFARFVGV